jgi:hypothetical protein
MADNQEKWEFELALYSDGYLDEILIFPRGIEEELFNFLLKRFTGKMGKWIMSALIMDSGIGFYNLVIDRIFYSVRAKGRKIYLEPIPICGFNGELITEPFLIKYTTPFRWRRLKRRCNGKSIYAIRKYHRKNRK